MERHQELEAKYDSVQLSAAYAVLCGKNHLYAARNARASVKDLANAVAKAEAIVGEKADSIIAGLENDMPFVLWEPDARAVAIHDAFLDSIEETEVRFSRMRVHRDLLEKYDAIYQEWKPRMITFRKQHLANALRLAQERTKNDPRPKPIEQGDPAVLLQLRIQEDRRRAAEFDRRMQGKYGSGIESGVTDG